MESDRGPDGVSSGVTSDSEPHPLSLVEPGLETPVPFDRNEAIKVGVVYCAIVNTAIYIASVSAVQTVSAGWVLLLSMLVIPMLVGWLTIVVGEKIIQNEASRAAYTELDPPSDGSGDGCCPIGPSNPMDRYTELPQGSPDPSTTRISR